jgi:chromosome segregation protein
MRVKKLEVFGFKSFAKKTTLHFEPGVTAIVGPNGSGKCVHGSSRVVLSDGRVVAIEELVETALRDAGHLEDWDDGQCTYENPYGLKVLSVNPATLQIESRPIAAFIKRQAPEHLLRIVTKTGRELTATAYHPLFTLESGVLKAVRADALQPGLRIAIPRVLPVEQTNDTLSLVDMLAQFEREDSVYLPYTSRLREWVAKVGARHGGLSAVARLAEVKADHVRTVYQQQALNVATAARLHDWSSTAAASCMGTAEPCLGSVLKSRVSGHIKVPHQLTSDLARFLGYCISEGRNASSDQIWFVNSDPALITDFCEGAQSVFGIEASVFSYKATSKDVIVFSHALCQYLEKAFQLGIDQPSREKQVPEALFGASDERVAAFLSALFEGDGYLHLRTKGRKRLVYIEYATASRRLAEDVQLLLSRFGVVSRIVRTMKAATNTQHRIRREYFSVFVYGAEQLKKLAERLEFRGEKRHRLAQLRALEVAPNPNDDLIPGATSLARDLIRSAGISVKRVRAAYPTLAAYHEQRCEATRPGLRRVVEAVRRFGANNSRVTEGIEQLEVLAESDLYWDEIVRVDQVPADPWVYDLAVADYHNFIADGMVVHNSNIVDSIRWVLGEHNPRDVRAPRLEDVIFNGTDQHAPLSMAEVHLTIENEQGSLPISFNEVTITRRVYRSGESECFINHSPCRLKDVQELFLGTGLGGGTYAIIEQGHIDLVLSSKPEERRVVFEEASGVAKYLAKKKETQRRLDEVEEHLVRIADIIGEVRRQVGALERAANKARQYKTQWEQLKSFELRLSVDELRSGQGRYAELERQVEALTRDRDSLETQKQQQVSVLETLNAAVSTVQQQLQDIRTTVMECHSAIEQHESQRAIKSRWIEELQQQAQRLAQEEQQLQQRLAQAEEQLARAGEGNTELTAQQAAMQTRLAQHAEELAAVETALQSARTMLNGAKAQLFEVASDATAQRNQLTQMTSRLHAIDAQLGRLEAQRGQLSSRAGDVRGRRQASLREHDALQGQYDEVQRRASATQQELERAAALRHERSGALHQLREQLATQRAQVTFLEALWRRYEGFPETVKTLMAQPVDGVLGPLADLVQAAPGYEEVVEAALGPLADSIVVRDRQALDRCRRVLHAQALESCRFLVLADCPSMAASMEQPKGQQVSAAVSQLVRTDPVYEPLVRWLLNDSWLVEDFERLLKETNRPHGRFVSMRGDRWDRRSWRFKTSHSAISRRMGRKQRWEQARQTLTSLEDALRQLEADATAAEAAWQTALARQESSKGELTHLAPSLQKLTSQLAQLAHEDQRLEAEQQALELEAQDLVAQREQVRASSRLAQQSVQEAQTRQELIERALSDAQAAREAAEQRQQQLLVAKAQREASLQSVTERLNALAARRQELESDRAQVAQQLEAKSRQRQEDRARAEELARQLEDHQQQQQQLTAERQQLDAEVERIAQAVRAEEAKRDHALPQLLAVEQQLATLNQQIQERAQQLAEREFRRARLFERLRELYQIDEATLQAEQAASMDAQALTDEQRTQMADHVQKLRAKLEGMGPVSLGSVEEYDELKRRLEFLQTQQQDLVQARDDLKTSIVQINKAARSQFRETFERITQEFKHYYTRLFSGGEANLILLDEEDVLECGIDIVARPPGKRLQNISLLSGGERALTAIALLFALFKVRPSPFCILDEIDAPLDEANIDRFTRVLEEFLSLSQFILITHNKKTITRADSLYGVTMQEAGVSTILSAKLSNGERSSPSSTVAVSA